MSYFEYLTVLFAIMVGLALADLVFSLHRLLVAGPRVKWDWRAPVAATVVTLLILVKWWVIYGYQTYQQQATFSLFLSLFVEFVLLSLLALAALPDEVPEAGLDLGQWYLAGRGRLFGLFALYTVFATAAGLARGAEFGALPSGAQMALLVGRQALTAGVCVALMRLKGRLWHALGLAILMATLLALAFYGFG
jgi:hypothetical protein